MTGRRSLLDRRGFVLSNDAVSPSHCHTMRQSPSPSPPPAGQEWLRFFKSRVSPPSGKMYGPLLFNPVSRTKAIKASPLGQRLIFSRPRTAVYLP